MGGMLRLKALEISTRDDRKPKIVILCTKNCDLFIDFFSRFILKVSWYYSYCVFSLPLVEEKNREIFFLRVLLING